MTYEISVSEFVLRLGWTLCHSIWQFAIIGMLTAAAFRVCSRCSANVRYTLGCIGMLLMYAALLVTFGQMSVQTDAFVEEPNRLVTVADSGENLRIPSVTPVADDGSEIGLKNLPTFPQHTKHLDDSGPTLVESVQLAAAPWLPWVVAGWSIGVVLLALRNAGGWFIVKRLRYQGANVVTEELQQRFRDLARRIRVNPSVVLMTSIVAEVPMVIGWLRPVVLMPSAMLAGIPAEQLEAILAHELAHIRRRDYLVNLLQLMTESLFFYHPAVWLISHRIRMEREFCCDDLAVELLPNRSAFVRALAAVETSRPAPTAALAMSGDSGPLTLQRARRLMGATKNTSGVGVLYFCVLTLAVATGAGVAACLSASPTSISEEQSSDSPDFGVEATIRLPVENETGDLPFVVIDIRNRGNQTFDFNPREQSYQIEVDGTWYTRMAKTRVPLAEFSPGMSHEGIRFDLDPKTWKTRESSQEDGLSTSLTVPPGSHSIRVRLVLQPVARDAQPLVVTSNSVDCFFAAPEAKEKQTSTTETSRGPVSRIYAVNRDGSGLSLLADENDAEQHTFLGSAAWSPDAAAVAFDATKNGQFARTRMFRKMIRGTTAGSVVDLGYGLGPRFSPNGTTIACYMNGRNPDGLKSGIYLMGEFGTDRKRISWGSLPRWSPNGNKILAVSSFSAPRNYVLIDVATGKAKKILTNQTGLGVPCWSPEGDRIATTVLDGEDRVLCIFKPEQEPESRIELWRDAWNGGYEETTPAWSPDKDTILFTHYTDSAIELLTIEATPDATPHPIVVAPFATNIRDCTWSPDSRRIMFAGIGNNLRALAENAGE